MAKRIKPQEKYPINSLDDADKALAQVAEAARKIEKIELKMNEDIDRIKAEAADAAAALKSSVKEISLSLKAYAVANKAKLFKDSRSIDLYFGSFGFRRTSSIKPAVKSTWAKVLEKLIHKGFKSGIRVKNDVNKEELSLWPDDKLTKVGARRVKTDQFWLKPAEENIKAGGK